jgi:hypothetical protein
MLEVCDTWCKEPGAYPGTCLTGIAEADVAGAAVANVGSLAEMLLVFVFPVPRSVSMPSTLASVAKAPVAESSVSTFTVAAIETGNVV